MFGDIFILGPYYVAAAWALVVRARWIRLPTFIYGSHVLTVAPILIAEHLRGRSPRRRRPACSASTRPTGSSPRS